MQAEVQKNVINIEPNIENFETKFIVLVQMSYKSIGAIYKVET